MGQAVLDAADALIAAVTTASTGQDVLQEAVKGLKAAVAITLFDSAREHMAIRFRDLASDPPSSSDPE